MNESDEVLIQCIQSGEPSRRNWALHRFYVEPVVRNWMRQYQATYPGMSGYMEDILQEAVIAFDRNIRNGKFQGKSSLTTYLLSIMKWMIANHNRKNKHELEFKPEMIDEQEDSIEVEIMAEERKSLLKAALDQIDARCRDLLTHYKLDFSMREIAEKLGFSSAEMAKKQAYRCREKLRNVLLSNPSLLQSLKD